MKKISSKLESKVGSVSTNLENNSSDLVKNIFFRLSPDLFCVASAEGYFTELNPAWESLLGYTTEELMSKPFIEFLHPDDIGVTEQEFAEELAGKAVLKFINRYRCKDGNYKWLEWHGLKSDESDVVYAVARDITGRMQIEEKLLEQESIHLAITTSARDAIILLDHYGNITFWNDASTTMLGYTKAEVLGKNLHELVVPERFIDNHHKAFHHFKSTGKGAAIGNTRELSAVHKNGREIPVELSLSAINSKDKWFSVGIMRDISDRKLSEGALKESEARLRELNSTKDKFFSIIAHDLRNPFIAIIGLLNILIKDYKRFGKEDIGKMLVMLLDHSKITFSLLENLLFWASAQSGRIEINPSMINIHDLVLENFELLKGLSDQKNQEMINNIPDPCLIFADAVLINTILRNLLSNSIKFTSHGGRILVMASEADDKVELSIHDTGVGIPPERLGNIFSIDIQTKTIGTDNESGTGLGLILCKEFVEKCGGKLWAESEVGTGSTFRFTIPKKY